MAKNISPDETSSIKTYIVRLARIPNYFNQVQRIVRIEFGDETDPRYFDFILTDTTRTPNNATTLAILQTYEHTLFSDKYAIKSDDPRMDLRPGYISEGEFDPTQLPYGFITDIIPKHATVFSSVNPDGDTGIAIRTASDPTDWENIQISLHGHLPDSYTTTEEKMESDPTYASYGLTIANDFTQITGPGNNGITFGPDGKMAISGSIHYSKSKGSYGMVADNPLAGWIPATVVTIPPAIDWLPNLDAIAAFGSLAQRTAKGITAVSDIAETVNAFREAQRSINV